MKTQFGPTRRSKNIHSSRAHIRGGLYTQENTNRALFFLRVNIKVGGSCHVCNIYTLKHIHTYILAITSEGALWVGKIYTFRVKLHILIKQYYSRFSVLNPFCMWFFCRYYTKRQYF